MNEAGSWEAFLAAHFPGYLLPEAYRRALPEDAAARFLSRLGGGPRQLFLLRAAGVAAAHAEAIRDLALVHLPSLATWTPPRTDRELRVREGELRGRLDVPATLRLRFAGRPTALASRAPEPRDDHPEDALTKAVVSRLLEMLSALADAGVLGRSGWGAALAPCPEALARTLTSAPLRDVGDEAIEPRHEDAARVSPHPAHTIAARLHRALVESLDDPDPRSVARAVAEGGLLPLADHTRFEIAVLIRLIQAIAARLLHFTLRHSIVASGRSAVAEFEGESATVRVHYDQACLDPGPYDAGVRRYLGPRGRLRPDITLLIEPAKGPPRAALVEAKLSRDPEYLAQSYRDAMVYRVEYGAVLSGWPKVVLVTSGPIAGAPSREDEVIAVGWDRWVPDEVLEGLLEGQG